MTESSMAPAAAAVNIGNYKGVMLCNRPFNGVSSTLAKDSRGPSQSYDGASKAAFLAGIPTEPLGMNVQIHTESPHAVKRDKKNTALSKHKKWLHDLQQERSRLQEALQEDEQQSKERKERFAQREAKMRDAVRNSNNNGDNGAGSDDEDASGRRKAPGKKLLARPMWALTQQTADEKVECMEDFEADQLIDFANNLDLDTFMDDVEIKARVAQVEQQMSQLQGIMAHEEAEEKRELQRELREREGAGGGLTAQDLARYKALSGNDDDGDDNMSVASTVLSECKSIRSVHSVRSVAVLTKRAEAKLTEAGGNATNDGDRAEATVNPRIVTIDEDKGVRMQVKTLASNLPYLHRNPAI